MYIPPNFSRLFPKYRRTKQSSLCPVPSRRLPKSSSPKSLNKRIPSTWTQWWYMLRNQQTLWLIIPWKPRPMGRLPHILRTDTPMRSRNMHSRGKTSLFYIFNGVCDPLVHPQIVVESTILRQDDVAVDGFLELWVVPSS